MSDFLIWTLSHGYASVDRPTRTYLQQLCTDTGCNLEDRSEVMGDRDEWREREREREIVSGEFMLALRYEKDDICNIIGRKTQRSVICRLVASSDCLRKARETVKDESCSTRPITS